MAGAGFLERIERGVLLGDGAMGTQLYQRGVFINRNYDELNLTDAHLIKAVHRDYVAAGAQVLETNTFGANRVKLGKHGLADRSYDINLAGASIARRCADEAAGVMVAGSVGPLGAPLAPVGTITEQTARDAFDDQLRGLIDGGIDVIMFETFLDLEELLLAVDVARARAPEMPIVAMMTVDHSTLTAYGRSPRQLAGVLDEAPVDLIGLNCSTGPQTILEAIEQMRPITSKPLAAFANAGEPRMVEGRIIYLATPEYFAEYAKRLIGNGVRYIGGCCGTGPEHIKLMASAIRALQPRDFSETTTSAARGDTEQGAASAWAERSFEPADLAPAQERSQLGKLFEEQAFPISCELHPPRTPNTGRILRQVRMLAAAGINVVNIPDGPRASARMSPMALAHIIMRETGMDTILHYTCRDRNILGMQSDLLGAEALGLNNILAVTGDPPKLGDYPMATAVFDVDAIGLLRIASQLNRGHDLAGNPIKGQTSFFLGAGFNPAAIDLELEVDRLHQKLESGCEYILTQPVFDLEKFDIAMDKVGELSVPVMVGILPLASFRNAEFFHNEVPGMEVPDGIRERMRIASEQSRERAAEEGVAIASEALAATKDSVQGAYVMPPFGRVELAIDTVSILEGRIRAEQARAALGEEESES